MTVQDHPRGGTPVGHMCDLGAVEAAAVHFLRLWADGQNGRDAAVGELTAALGEKGGLATALAFEALFDLCARHGRRPLMRHDVLCGCLGADEACFATFISAAAEPAEEDAMMMAVLLVRADLAPILANLARDVGVSLRRFALAKRPEPARMRLKTLH